VSNSLKIFFILFLLTGLAAIFRLWQLDKLPAVLHRDETSIAYNAYSLLQTGRDEHGQAWPISFESFGDYKLPGMIYATSGSIKLFGLNNFAARFPTALAAILTIPALFWLLREMKFSKKIGFLAALLLSLDFWHITQARNAYEPMAGLLFSVLGFASVLAARRNSKYFVLALLFYAVGALFYNMPFLLLPMLYVSSWWLLNRKIDRSVALALFGVLALIIGVSWLVRGVNASRSNTTVFNHPDIVAKASLTTHAGLVGDLPSLLSRGLNHHLLWSGVQVAAGFVAAFNPTYLFFTGDQNPWHNLREIGLGDMNPALLLAFLLGLYAVGKNIAKASSKLVLLYLLLSPLVSAVTIDAPITNRLLDFHLAVLIIAAVGIDYAHQTWWLSKQVRLRALFAAWVAIYVGFLAIFALRYFFMFNPLLHSFWNPGLPEMIDKVNAELDNYDRVFISSDLDIAYTYFAYYTPFDPKDFQTRAKWRKDGFFKVDEYRKYKFASFPSFAQLSPENVAAIFNDDNKKLLVVGRGEPNKDLSLLWEQTDWRGRTL